MYVMVSKNLSLMLFVVAGAYPSPAIYVIFMFVVAGAYPSPAIYVIFMFVVAGAYPSPAIYVTALSCLLLLGLIPHQLAGAYPSPAIYVMVSKKLSCLLCLFIEMTGKTCCYEVCLNS
jgi:hypothetical protein